MSRWTYTEDNAALWYFFVLWQRRSFEPKVHSGHPFMLFKLGADLVRDCLRPWIFWQVQVLAEYSREVLRFNELFVQIPHKRITDSVRLGLKLDAYRHERRWSARLMF